MSERLADPGEQRLQKALAAAGIASRRACETLITRGRVRVNGKTVYELGTKINTERDEVRVDGVIVQLDVAKRYFVLNKPTGVVSTMRDEQGRADLREFTADFAERLYNVGRLDTDTSGLLILTNDGELAHKLAHPKFGVQKTYIAKVRGRVSGAVVQRLRDGVELEDGPIAADAVKVLPGATSRSSLVEITLHSGRNRIVRRMLAKVGHPVEELVRRQFGPLHLGTLGSGHLRELSAAERNALLTAAAQQTHDERGQKRRRQSQRGQQTQHSQRAGSGSGERRSWHDAGRDGLRQADPHKNRAPKQRHRDRPVTAGRPGDGAGATGLRGIAKPRPQAKPVKRGRKR